MFLLVYVGSGEHILCFHRSPYGNCGFTPSLETRSGENVLCFDEFMLGVMKTYYVFIGRPMETVVSTPLLSPEVVKTSYVLMSSCWKL